MGIGDRKSLHPAEGERKETKHAGHAEGEPCRCEETSKMTPRELLKLMMDDLAFWKKGKKS